MVIPFLIAFIALGVALLVFDSLWTPRTPTLADFDVVLRMSDRPKSVAAKFRSIVALASLLAAVPAGSGLRSVIRTRRLSFYLNYAVWVLEGAAGMGSSRDTRRLLRDVASLRRAAQAILRKLSDADVVALKQALDKLP